MRELEMFNLKLSFWTVCQFLVFLHWDFHLLHKQLESGIFKSIIEIGGEGGCCFGVKTCFLVRLSM